jgi:hypothetical protein
MKAIIALAATATVLSFSAAQAQKDPPGVNPEHYSCYRVSPAKPFKAQKVTLSDQFGNSTAYVVQEALLCTPVSKNDSSIKDKVTHLLCYTLKADKSANKAVSITNQFGTFTMKVGLLTQLCVPSLKKVL